jgi:hypothetical protein
LPTPPGSSVVLDGAAIGDVDYTASVVLARVLARLSEEHIRVVFTNLLEPVREQLDHYGIVADAYYDTPGEALEAFHRSTG